jgi:methionine-rich copper-binding protein CopC
MTKRLLTAAVVVLLSLAGLPAQSHSQLIDANPKPNQTISAPAKVTLTFNEELINLGERSNVITVTNSKNQRVAVSATVVDQNKLTASFQRKLTAGRYTIWWRAVSADGHPISGKYRFTVRR